jgi:1-acyl-sn-glycerol-3-phosphate acyltransferase
LQKGFPVILFPEGTTSDLPGMLPFKKGAIRTAVKYNLPVVPVAVCFVDKRDFWVGEATFLQHAWSRFQEKKIAVQVIYGSKMQDSDSERLELEVRQWIEKQLTDFAQKQNLPDF